MILPKNTRSNTCDCNCHICRTATFKGHKKTAKGAGRIRDSVKLIDASSGLYGASNISQQKIDSSSSFKKSNNSVNLCKKCFQEVRKGKTHAVDCKKKCR